jgi:hypothetical protein
MGIDGLHHIRETLTFRGNQGEDRGFGLGPKVAYGLGGALPVGLVDHHDVGNFQ